MAKVVLSLLAQADEAYIARDLTRKAGYSVAQKYAARFERLYNRLSGFPESGSPRPKIGSRVRIGVVSPFIVPHRFDLATDT
jgi:plasmid stabilization system protein ParE